MSAASERFRTRRLNVALWSTANAMPLITSSTVELPASSEALMAIRFAPGAMPTYLPLNGSPAARWLESPAMMPATCVPWPKPSPAVAAAGEVMTLATTRELPAASLKSGWSPAMPVSITPTPMPAPVMPRCHSLSARVVFG